MGFGPVRVVVDVVFGLRPRPVFGRTKAMAAGAGSQARGRLCWTGRCSGANGLRQVATVSARASMSMRPHGPGQSSTRGDQDEPAAARSNPNGLPFDGLDEPAAALAHGLPGDGPGRTTLCH